MRISKDASKDWPWPAPQDDGAAKHIIPGTRLPDVARDGSHALRLAARVMSMLQEPL